MYDKGRECSSESVQSRRGSRPVRLVNLLKWAVSWNLVAVGRSWSWNLEVQQGVGWSSKEQHTKIGRLL